MSNIFFGTPDNVFVGQIFQDRQALIDARLHRTRISGIDGNGREGASAIVLSGGYVDDQDLGDVIIYTGHGGNDPDTKKQIADQSWDATGNKGLLRSMIQGYPVRVIRGSNHISPYSPKKGYAYAGLYSVVDNWQDIGRDGFKICRYRLVKIKPNAENIPIVEESKQTDYSENKRSENTTLRIIRDSRASKAVKELYDYKCQICSLRITIKDIPYAESAHIRPLGKPHNGPDTIDNLLCLCPNHHVMFDKGIFSIDKDFSLIGIEGIFTKHPDHYIYPDNLKYHRDHIYIH